MESVLAWWELAGVDSHVGDSPRNWLQTLAATNVFVEIPPANSGQDIPQTLDKLLEFLGNPLNFPELGGRRPAPAGAIESPYMLMGDIPSLDDLEEDRLFSGSAGRLLDAMLASIGLSRESIWLANIAPGRPPSGMLSAGQEAGLDRFAKRHVALTGSRSLLVFGDSACRVLLGGELKDMRGRAHTLLLDGDRSVRAIATYHPRFLLRHPVLKADAWTDLRLFMETASQ